MIVTRWATPIGACAVFAAGKNREMNCVKITSFIERFLVYVIILKTNIRKSDITA